MFSILEKITNAGYFVIEIYEGTLSVVKACFARQKQRRCVIVENDVKCVMQSTTTLLQIFATQVLNFDFDICGDGAVQAAAKLLFVHQNRQCRPIFLKQWHATDGQVEMQCLPRSILNFLTTLHANLSLLRHVIGVVFSTWSAIAKCRSRGPQSVHEQ